jgi:Fe-S cluster assembly protein SufD
VNDQFSPTVAAALPGCAWRREAVDRAEGAGWPSSETEEWRYSPIGELTLDGLAPVLAAPTASLVPDVPVADRAATVTLLDGWVVDITIAPGWADKGLAITVGSTDSNPTDSSSPDSSSPGSSSPDSSSIEGDEELTAFDWLHRAFSPAPVVVRTATGLTVRDPVVIVNHHATAGAASFAHLVVEAGDGSDLVVVEHQSSVSGPGLSVPVTGLRVGAAARLRYQVIQDVGRQHWQIARQWSRVGGQATLVSGVAAFGGHYARLRTDSRLVGRGASANLVAAYYGDSDQIHDFRTFQHHDARNTRSDLLFKGAQDGSSGSIYTGMIHIHADGAGSNAFQTNRNVKLSPDAWAWSVPNLEIENSDVRCSHASTVSPVDPDQRFYLQSRGVPPLAADRLIVAGFFDEVLDRLPVDSLRDEVRRHLRAKLDLRGPPGQGGGQ